MLRIPYICVDNIMWEESIIADSESELIVIPIERIKKYIKIDIELQRRIYCKSLSYFIHNNVEKAGELVYYPDREMKKLARDARLVTFRGNEKV
jgi:hypothetical protein